MARPKRIIPLVEGEESQTKIVDVTPDDEMFSMVKKMEAMYSRCGQLERETNNKFVYVVQTNLRHCINKINMFAKNV